VPNHAYLGAIRRNEQPKQRLVTGLAKRAATRTAQRADTQHQGEIRQLLIAEGFTPLAAGTIARAHIPEVAIAIHHHLTGEPAPPHLDPDYLKHIATIYTNPDFAWNPRYHQLDSTSRQTLIDIVEKHDGNMNYRTFLNTAKNTLGLTTSEIVGLVKGRTAGNAPPWQPVLNITGNTAHRARHHERNIELFACPHCTQPLTRAIRTPETPDGLICPHCRRTQQANSPIFPASYLINN